MYKGTWIAATSLTIAMVLFGARASAQSNAGSIQVSGGYSALHESVDEEGFWDHGFRADVFVPFARMAGGRFGGVGEFSVNHNGDFDDNLVGVLGGVRLSFPSRAFEPFVQLLLGVEHCCDPGQNGFTFQVGGGVTRWITPMFGVRGQFDFRRARYSDNLSDGSLSYNEPIIGASVVLRFGS